MSQRTESSTKLIDAAMIKKMAEQVQKIYDCLFGSPAHPQSGLFLHVDRNTRFRQNATRLFFVLIPIIISIIFYLFTHHKGAH